LLRGKQIHSCLLLKRHGNKILLQLIMQPSSKAGTFTLPVCLFSTLKLIMPPLVLYRLDLMIIHFCC